MITKPEPVWVLPPNESEELDFLRQMKESDKDYEQEIT
jgi:hypothetical protein